MTDMLVRSAADNGIQERWVDMGDGTRALQVVSMDRTQVAGGASTFRAVSAATTNAAVIKTSAGIVYGIQMTNMAPLNAARTVKLYNQDTVPIAGDIPAMTLVLPGTGFYDFTRSRGVAFPNGIAIAITAGLLDNLFTAVGLGDVTVNLNFT